MIHSEMYKIALIIPYFGEFPVWMDLFFSSCRWNHNISSNITIDWFFITDNLDNEFIRKECPYLHFINVDFEEYCRSVSDKLDIEFTPSKAYKLCDLKPFYGIIHKDLLEDYTHWGYGDIDLCYGDLSLLIDEERLSRFDLLTTHADRVAGHLTIIRKESKYTRMCFQIDNYKSKLMQGNLGLDEHDFTNLVRSSMAYWEYVYRRFLKKTFRKVGLCMYDFMRIPNWIHNLFSKSYMREYYTSLLPNNGEVWYLDLKEHKIYNPQNKEIPYLHFLFFKKTPYCDTPNYWKPGFYQLRGSIPTSGYILFSNEKIAYKEHL